VVFLGVNIISSPLTKFNEVDGSAVKNEYPISTRLNFLKKSLTFGTYSGLGQKCDRSQVPYEKADKFKAHFSN
jgi:hypothetical protein